MPRCRARSCAGSCRCQIGSTCSTMRSNAVSSAHAGSTKYSEWRGPWPTLRAVSVRPSPICASRSPCGGARSARCVVPDERAARRALACVTEAGDPRLSALVATNGPVELWETLLASSVESAWSRRAKALSLEKVEESEALRGIRFVVPGDAEWPVLLFDLERCAPVQELGGVPLGLWVRGAHPLGDLATRSVAVVGSRASTPYGDRWRPISRRNWRRPGSRWCREGPSGSMRRHIGGPCPRAVLRWPSLREGPTSRTRGRMNGY